MKFVDLTYKEATNLIKKVKDIIFLHTSNFDAALKLGKIFQKSKIMEINFILSFYYKLGNAIVQIKKAAIFQVQSKVEAFIQKLMNEKGDKIHNKQFCSHTQIVLKDRISSDLKKTELTDISSNFGNGFKADDKQTKNQICSKLSEYY